MSHHHTYDIGIYTKHMPTVGDCGTPHTHTVHTHPQHPPTTTHGPTSQHRARAVQPARASGSATSPLHPLLPSMLMLPQSCPWAFAILRMWQVTSHADDPSIGVIDMCSLTVESVLLLRARQRHEYRCSIESVLLLLKVFSYFRKFFLTTSHANLPSIGVIRKCSLTVESVLLRRRTPTTRVSVFYRMCSLTIESVLLL